MNGRGTKVSGIRVKVAIAGVAALALVAAGCGGAAEIVNEQLLESIEGVENVEFDEGNGSFEITIEQDGESMTIGGGEIPDGMTVPVADGGEVVGSSSSDSSLSVSLTYPKDRYEGLVAEYEAWADGSGREIQKSESTYTYEDDGQEQRSASWATDDGSVYITVTDCIGATTGEFDSACVTIYEQ